MRQFIPQQLFKHDDSRGGGPLGTSSATAILDHPVVPPAPAVPQARALPEPPGRFETVQDERDWWRARVIAAGGDPYEIQSTNQWENCNSQCAQQIAEYQAWLADPQRAA